MENQECVIEKRDIGILMLGLDEAGKTTLLYKLKQGDGDVETIPTIGYNVETVKFEDQNYKFWDIGGLKTVRVLWNFYKENKAAVMFVVDASNSQRLPEAKDFLHTVMAEEVFNNTQLLVISNKQDKANCANDEDLQQQLDLKSLKHPWRFVRSSAFDRKSLNDIMEHLRDMNLF